MDNLKWFLFFLVIFQVQQIECENLKAFDKFLLDILPRFIGQQPNNQNGTFSEFRKFAVEDTSNDSIGRSTSQQIITRSSYHYENHYVLADDGYVTQLIRIVNPFVERAKLKQPPVLLFHGGIIDTTAWIWASAVQHYPEKYPRLPEDGPIASWNRSIAFMLANNGYDVWLIGTRGSNAQNQGHIKLNASAHGGGFDGGKFVKLLEKLNRYSNDGTLGHQEGTGNLLSAELDIDKYWDYSYDEIIQHEIPKQIDKVLQITGAMKVSIICISLSTQTTLALLGSNKEYASKVHSYVCIAPILNNIGSNKILSNFHRGTCRNLPVGIGNALLPRFILTQFTRDILLLLTKSKDFRYSVFKFLTSVLVGSSGKYHTFLEPAVIGHLFMPIGFKEIKHYCQITAAGRLQKFDHGAKKNKKLYGKPKPPAYSIRNIHVKNWMLITGETDNLAPQASTRQLLREANPKPKVHVFVPNFNHLDLVAGFENDKYVNLPILEFLDAHQLVNSSEDYADSAELLGQRMRMSADEPNLEQFVPAIPPSDASYSDSIGKRTFDALPSSG